LNDFDCVLLHGGMTPTERRQAAARFTHGDAAVLLATDAASEGLNLQHRCRLVINLDLPWTPLRLEQRVGRIDRLGQQRPVHAVHFVGRGTSEADVIDRLIARDKAARASLDAIVRLTSQDVASIVMGRQEGDRRSRIESIIGGAGITPHLREESRVEASRIALSRTLRCGSASTDLDRPFATFIGKPRRVARGYWLWRTTIEGVLGDWLWDACVSVVVQTVPLRARSARTFRNVLAASAADLNEAADRAAQSAMERFREDTRIPLTTAIARERAIAATLAAQHATLATSLIQRGLFDRRAERRSAEQREIIADGANRSAERLDELLRWQTPAATERHLVFAVLLD
jgi:hypothetical protein